MTAALKTTLGRLDCARNALIEALIESNTTADLLRYSRALADVAAARREIEDEIAACERLQPYVSTPAARRA